MRPINSIIIHCSATRVDEDLTEQQLEAAHIARGLSECGFHYYVRYSGLVVSMRDLDTVGEHCPGHDEGSDGICYEGGVNCFGEPADTRSFHQKCSIRALIRCLQSDFPNCHIYGCRELSTYFNCNGKIHRDSYEKLSPCYSVAAEFYPPYIRPEWR